jgi:hypothetical protein
MGALQREDAFDVGGYRHSHPPLCRTGGNHGVPQCTNSAHQQLQKPPQAGYIDAAHPDNNSNDRRST